MSAILFVFNVFCSLEIMKPEGKNWLFAILILGDIIQTFALELIAILCPSECVVSPLACAVSPTSANGTCVAAPANGTCTCVVTATVTIFSVIGIVSAIIPGILYVCKRIYDECQSNNDIKDKCQHYIDVTISCLYALLGPPLYYYGDNVSKVVDLVGDTFGCSADCQRALRISGVAVLFFFLLMNILIGRISKSKESKLNSKWWGPVADMIVELLPLHILYSAFLSIARSNMIFTSTSFCSEGERAVFAVVCTITFSYAIFSILYSFMKFIEEKPPTGYKVIVGVSGIVVFLGFVVYLLLDNSLPLDFRLCYASVDDIAAVMMCLHNVRAGLSAFCAIVVVCLGAVPAVLYECKKQYPMTQARLKDVLEATLVKQLMEQLNNLSEEQSVGQDELAAQFVLCSLITEFCNLSEAQIEEHVKKLKGLKGINSITALVASQLEKELKDVQSDAVDQLVAQLQDQLKDVQSDAVDQLVAQLQDQLKDVQSDAVDQLVAQLQDQFVAKLVTQLVAQFVAAKSMVHLVAKSVAASVAPKLKMPSKDLIDQLKNAELVPQLKAQSAAAEARLIVYLVDKLKDTVVDKSAEYLEEAVSSIF